MANKIAFVDRDGTLIVEPADYQVDRLDKIELMPGVIAAMHQMQAAGFRWVMVTNQDGLGTESFPENEFTECQDFVVRLFASQGITFDEVLVCPHFPDAGCDCRKPRTGLLTRYLAQSPIDSETSVVIGDRETDIELAENLGIRGFLINESNDWRRIADQLCHQQRTATVRRDTNETQIAASINLDANTADSSIQTGTGFFDHMLEQIARHADIQLNVDCQGDLHIDEHHTVEDTALCIGQALKQALGDRKGIERFGFVLPMDETEAKVSLDLCGRAFIQFDGEFPRETVGGLATEMVPHFFRSLSDALGATLHIEVHGENTHHMVESCFKAFGRTLGQAVKQTGDQIPSSKGVLD